MISHCHSGYVRSSPPPEKDSTIGSSFDYHLASATRLEYSLVVMEEALLGALSHSACGFSAQSSVETAADGAQYFNALVIGWTSQTAGSAEAIPDGTGYIHRPSSFSVLQALPRTPADKAAAQKARSALGTGGKPTEANLGAHRL